MEKKNEKTVTTLTCLDMTLHIFYLKGLLIFNDEIYIIGWKIFNYYTKSSMI